MRRRDQILRKARKFSKPEDWELYKSLRNRINNRMKRSILPSRLITRKPVQSNQVLEHNKELISNKRKRRSSVTSYRQHFESQYFLQILFNYRKFIEIESYTIVKLYLEVS